jgi:hypothetical protein
MSPTSVPRLAETIGSFVLNMIAGLRISVRRGYEYQS